MPEADRSRDEHARDDVDSREAARNRRRDRDAGAEARDLMRPGMGKVFKQIQDSQGKAAKAAKAGEGSKPASTEARRTRRG